MPVLTQEEYEDFYVSPEDLPMLMDMSKEKTIVEQNISEYGGMYPYKFIFKTNK